ncbi:MAG: glycosyltransferase family 2 protein [Proteobacteria bacterium]|nr:glycosyltransferase family 2 protein [Pseudomonadota bacterium]
MSDSAEQGSVASTVAILLCSMHGQHFIAEQLESIAAQTHPHWTVWISDDGSQDDTHKIIRQYLSKWGDARVSIQSGPTQGYAANFLSLIRRENIRARYYAFADQDDVWEPDKLARAIAWLDRVPDDTPALYCSRTRLIDEHGREMGYSPLIRKHPSFANALVQNIGGGNTIVFNEATRDLLREVGEEVRIVAHDWWAYQVVTGCGGQVFYDPYPSVRYRQHLNNQVGSNTGWSNMFWRLRELLKGRFRRWNDINIEALQTLRSRLTQENRKILDEFRNARNRSLIPRLMGLKRSGINRQSLIGNLGLACAAIFKRI